MCQIGGVNSWVWILLNFMHQFYRTTLETKYLYDLQVVSAQPQASCLYIQTLDCSGKKRNGIT